MVRCLLWNGVRAKEEQMPLHVTSRLGETEIVQLLLQHVAQPDVTTMNRYAPLHISAWDCQVHQASVLLEAGAAHSLATETGSTPCTWQPSMEAWTWPSCCCTRG